MYSWKKLGVCPAWPITSSSGSCIRVENIAGTPVSAAAWAAAMSPALGVFVSGAAGDVKDDHDKPIRGRYAPKL